MMTRGNRDAMSTQRRRRLFIVRTQRSNLDMIWPPPPPPPAPPSSPSPSVYFYIIKKTKTKNKQNMQLLFFILRAIMVVVQAALGFGRCALSTVLAAPAEWKPYLYSCRICGKVADVLMTSVRFSCVTDLPSWGVGRRRRGHGYFYRRLAAGHITCRLHR